MKKIIVIFLMFIVFVSNAQDHSTKKLPSVKLTDMNGKQINTAELRI
jgi:hypothetical protein